MMKKVMMLSVLLAFVVSAVRAQSLEDGLNAIDAEQYVKAKGIFGNLVKTQPKKGLNYFYLGYSHLLNGNIDSARVVFQQGLTADPKTITNTVGLSVADLYDGKINEAESKFKELAAGFKKKNAFDSYVIGRAYLDIKEPDYAKAIQYIAKSEEYYGKKVDPRVLIAKGDAYLGVQNNSTAYRFYEDALDLNPNLIRGKLNQALIIRAARAYEESIADLVALKDAFPSYAPAYRELAETYYLWSSAAVDTVVYRERNRQAVEYYRQYLDHSGYSVENRIRYADFLVFAKNYDELQKQAEELVKVENINPKIFRFLGYSLYAKQDYKGSIDALKQMFEKMDPELVISRDYLHLGLSQVFLASQQEPIDKATFDAGIAQVRKAVELDVANADDLQNIALDQQEKNNYEGAYKLFQISANAEDARNKLSDTFYFGLYAAIDNINKRVENPEYQPDPVLLQQIDEAFASTLKVDSSILEAYEYRARNRSFMEIQDGFGTAEPYYINYLNAAKIKGDAQYNRARSTVIDVYNGYAHLFYNSEDYAKAKHYAQKTLELDPADEYALQVVAYVDRLNASR
jgi:predicted Zn-dependent protease